jgi:hypothetical protein
MRKMVLSRLNPNATLRYHGTVGPQHTSPALALPRKWARTRDVMLTVLLAPAMYGCSSPTSSACANGVDQLGRGPTLFLTTQCTPVGSDLQCVGKVQEEGYCANTKPITGKAQWNSLEPQTAVFENPAQGFLKVLAPGIVEVNFTYYLTSGGFASNDPIAFSVSPGSTPERMVRFGVVVYANNVGINAPRVPDVTLRVQPARGPEQTCQTSKTGACEFWVLSSDVQITATKDGYVPAQVTSPVTAQDSLFLRGFAMAIAPVPPS